MIKDSNEYDAIYPASLFKRNLNSVIRKFESRKWTHVLITRNNKPIAEVIHPIAIVTEEDQLNSSTNNEGKS